MTTAEELEDNTPPAEERNDHGSCSVENGVASESCVLHLRRLPLDITDMEVAILAVPFGGLSNMVVTKKTGQALIEMQSQEAARLMLNYYNDVARPIIRRPAGPCEIAIQYSRYSHLSTTGGSTQLYSAINQANQNAQSAAELGPRNVLRVQVDGYPIQVPLGHVLFHQIFARFGTIRRIISFMTRKSSANTHSSQPIPQPQALIEFDNPISAHVAKLQTHQMTFSPFGGHLLVDFSRQKTLEVRLENHLCRDYTLHPLNDVEQLAVGIAALNPDPQTIFPNGDFLPIIYPAQRFMTNGHRHSDTDMYRRSALYPGCPVSLMTHNPSIERFVLPPNASPVLIVSQLNADKVSPDVLFTLFGVYGDVIRVKVMFSKRDTALVQFVDAGQAYLGLENLHGCPLFGQNLQCNFSRHLHIKMPPAGALSEEETAMTKDYTDSGLHRYRRINSRNYVNIYPPSCVLHVSNLPPEMTAEKLAEAFAREGHKSIQAKLMQNDKRMALVQFETVESAISALVKMHNQQLDPEAKQRVRVCFSKIHMGPPAATIDEERS